METVSLNSCVSNEKEEYNAILREILEYSTDYALEAYKRGEYYTTDEVIGEVERKMASYKD